MYCVQNDLELVLIPYGLPLHLQRRRIPCESLNSKMGEKERKRVLADLSCKVPETRFMYVTPEQCATPTFQGGNSIYISDNRTGDYLGSFWGPFLVIV